MFNGFGEIIFFAAIAAFVAYRLHNVLGRKDIGPVEQKKKPKPVAGTSHNLPEKDILRFPYKEIKPQEAKGEGNKPVPPEEVCKGVTDPEKVKVLMAIHSAQASFTVPAFLKGAKAAFEMVLEAFAKGEKEVLAKLLEEKLYATFEKEINQREKEKHQSQVTLVSFLATKVQEVVLHKDIAHVVVDFVTEQIRVTKDSEGNILEGDPAKVVQMNDIWTFEKDITSTNPNWQLVKTGG